MPNHFILIFFYYERCRDFARKSKSRGGTLVACVYFKESTYSWNIQSACQKKSRFAWTGAAWNLWVMMTFLLFYCSSSSSGRARGTIAVIILLKHFRKTQHIKLFVSWTQVLLPSLPSMLVSRAYLGINVCQINMERKGKENLASVSTIMTGTEEFTLIVASWVIKARWREIQRFVLEFKAS